MASSSQERCQTCQLTLGRTRKSITHRSTRWGVGGGGGGGGGGTPPKRFCYVAVFRNDFAVTGRPLIFSTRDRKTSEGGLYKFS